MSDTENEKALKMMEREKMEVERLSRKLKMECPERGTQMDKLEGFNSFVLSAPTLQGIALVIYIGI